MKDKRKLTLNKATVVDLEPLTTNEKGQAKGGLLQNDGLLQDDYVAPGSGICCETCHCG